MLFSLLEGTTRGAFPSPTEVGIEEVISNLVLWLKLVIEVVGALLIGIGVAVTSARVAGVLRHRQLEVFGKARLGLARFLALGLEFQLAADIVATAFAPSWTQISKLGAIAVIRTGLNYFLGCEMKEGQEKTLVQSAAAKNSTFES
jgi:uncharacterized membrane protein